MKEKFDTLNATDPSSLAILPGGNVRIVITGKGGVGKTTLTALLAHSFAREGYSVLAVDGDPQQNLAATLGVPRTNRGRIVPLSERKSYIAEKIGARAGRNGFMTLNPETADVVDRFGIKAGNGIRLLVLGGVKNAGSRQSRGYGKPSFP